MKIINNKRPCIGNKEEYQNDINVLIYMIKLKIICSMKQILNF